jgi:hypothetical protein
MIRRGLLERVLTWGGAGGKRGKKKGKRKSEEGRMKNRK